MSVHRWISTVVAGLCTAAILTSVAACQSAGPRLAEAPGSQVEVVDAEYIRTHYTKREAQIPMRDGTLLFTTIYSPKDRSWKYPILMRRTPYSARPYGPDEFPERLGPEPNFVRGGYIFVVQDVRGRFMSEGNFVNMTPHVPRKRNDADFDESSDCYDTIEWLLANVENHNGRVGMWGISYPGFYSAASMIDAHPALVAVSPQAPIADWWFDDFHHHGAFFLPHGFNFLSVFGLPNDGPFRDWPERPFQYPSVDGYDFYLDHVGPLSTLNGPEYLDGRVQFWNDIVAHPNYDEFWQSRDIVPHLSNVAPAVLTVGGWFDAEDLYGPLAIYRSIEEKNPAVDNRIVMGPWRHGGWNRDDGDRLGNAYFGSRTGIWFQTNVQKPFFDHHLKDEMSPDLPEALVFETGANRWRRFDQWPPSALSPMVLYASESGSLSAERPEQSGPAFDAFVSDPAKPVPYTEDVSIRMTREYMTDDQRFAGRRPDVLVYQTEPLEEAVTIAGPVLANLWVSTTGDAADWVVKLIDVHPGLHEDYPEIEPGMRTGGYQMLVRSEVIRGRFRNSHERPEPFTPDEPTNVRLPLQDVLHTFKPGHRIMIQVQSTWFPLVDRNPQTYVENIFLAEPDDFTPQTHRVHRSANHPTRLEFGVVRGSEGVTTVGKHSGG